MMAVRATPRPSEAPRANLRLVRPSDGIRADAERVIVPLTDALTPWIELIAIADDVLASAERIALAAMAGSRSAVINEANRLAFRVTASRREARERIGAIEPTPGAAA